MKTDLQIQKDVMDELKWQPFLTASQIGVAVQNGIVTLSGKVDSFSKKLAAEEAAKKVAGVKAIAEDIQVGVSPAFKMSDTDLAAAVVNALKWHGAVQEEHIKIEVEDGCVKLEGEVEWDFQRRMVRSAIEHLTGVKAVYNLISVKPKVVADELHKKINAAFHRNATVDAGKIDIEVEGSKVTLRGKVRSLAEKEEAERTVWLAPGVFSVTSKIEVQEPELVF